ncbi:MAG TPA: serine hydroxymethyltransferase [Rhodospirillaceae bacterium]|jgi:glycine hydroxymethyltransferase|nr:serine hydroxymethyltransferase [Alphaproteobacteria bacterium]HBH26913.1 serine hydroxymethyltransferase [Rhodospirillaceae bacterium]
MTNLAAKRDARTTWDFYNQPLREADSAIFQAIEAERARQAAYLELIASENMTSRAVMDAQGTILTNKYAEGLPGKRYYSGCDHIDTIEQIAIDRATALFGCNFANVQPNSGSQSNQAVYLALIKPGAKILSMALDHGGHLTHGSPVNVSGKWFDVTQYGIRDDNGEIDYDEVERMALETQPDMVVCGASAYARIIDWARFRQIADKVGAWLLADIAHYAGLVAGGAIPSPFPHVHIATTTTHKTLRGPRGGLILWNDEELSKKINSAVFPGMQGGPLEHVIAAKAVAFGQALEPAFKDYAQAVVDNARALAGALAERGYTIVSGGTDTHVFLVDLQKQGLVGLPAQRALYRAHLNCNRNAIPNDPQKPWYTSGLRFGSPAGTTRGLGVAEFTQVGHWIADVLDGLVKSGGKSGDTEVEGATAARVAQLLQRFPVYERA